jgi:hypothetical protein
LRFVLALTLLVSLCIMPAITTAGSIPNLTNSDEQVVKPLIPNMAQDEDTTNGRPQHLDSDDRSAEDLNPVEKKIIQRDTIISNESTRVGSEVGH